MSPEQRAESILQVSAWAEDDEETRHRLLMVGIAAAQLYDVGYLACNSLRLTHTPDGGFWDPLATYRDEAELWTRLEPLDETRWHRHAGGLWIPTSDLPLAPECQADPLYATRRMRDPLGGQEYVLGLNPSERWAWSTPPHSARLVTSTSGGGVGRAVARRAPGSSRAEMVAVRRAAGREALDVRAVVEAAAQRNPTRPGQPHAYERGWSTCSVSVPS
jgi:hypothetical protein